MEELIHDLINSKAQSRAIRLMQRFVSSDSILIMNILGIVLRLRCPFKVLCLVEEKDLEVDEAYVVVEVRGSKQHRLEYLIEENWYPLDSFIIL